MRGATNHPAPRRASERSAERNRHIRIALVHAVLAIAADVSHPGKGNTAA